MIAIASGLLLATFVSEDLACITAALLIQRGEIDATTGIGACAAGIFLGDCGLWGIGRLGASTASSRPRNWLQTKSIDQIRSWIVRNGAAAVFASRFLPGLRLPIYVAAGVLRMPFKQFAAWTFVAALIWTPLVVLLASSTPAIVGPVLVLAGLHGIRWMSSPPRWKRRPAQLRR